LGGSMSEVEVVKKIKQMYIPCWKELITQASHPWNGWIQRLYSEPIDEADFIFDYVDAIGRVTKYYVSKLSSFKTGSFLKALEHCFKCEDCMMFNIRVQGFEYSYFTETLREIIQRWNEQTGQNIDWRERYLQLIEEKRRKEYPYLFEDTPEYRARLQLLKEKLEKILGIMLSENQVERIIDVVEDTLYGDEDEEVEK
jgi:hypothetical protein